MSDWLTGADADFEAMEKEPPEAAPEPKARDEKGKFTKPADKPKPKAKEPEPEVEEPQPEKEPAEPEPKPAEEPEKKPEEAKPKPEDLDTSKPLKAATIREAYEGLKKKLKELEPELQSARAKLKEIESRKPQELEPVLSELKAARERNAQLEKVIAFKDYTESDEYRQKYAEPYREAWADATAEFRELTVREPAGKDEFDEPKFVTRQADENDLLRLANMKLSDMDAAAQEMFGASAARAINHIQNIKKLSAAQSRAIQEAKTNADKWRTERMEKLQTEQKSKADAWLSANHTLREKFPKAFEPESGDAEDAGAHLRGFALADLAYLGSKSLSPQQIEALPPEFRDTVKSGQPLSTVQQVRLDALARLRAANQPRLIAKLKKTLTRLAEVEKSLAAYEKSEPPAGKSGDPKGKIVSKDWLQTAEDELRQLDK